MSNTFELNSLLVPVDFSPASDASLARAMTLATGTSPVLIMLHVIDPSLAEFAVAHQWGSSDDIIAQMRARAESQLEIYREQAVGEVEIDTIVSVGPPFLEILKKSEDFAVDAIVIGKVGARGSMEKLLFGSTAEKVLRGSRRPVIVLPIDE